MGGKTFGPQDERDAIINSVLHFFGSQLTSRAANKEEVEEDRMIKGSSFVDLVGWTKLRELLEDFFPSYNTVASGGFSFPAELENVIKMQLKERHLQCLPGLMDKVFLYIAEVYMSSVEIGNF